MAKTLIIKIKPIEEALAGFRKTFKALEAGRRVRRREGVYFTSVEAARKLLTRNRLALLRTVRRQQARSIYGLAKSLNRDLKNVQEDLRLLEEFGLIQMAPARGLGNRKVKVPKAPFDEIALRIAI